MIAMIEDGFYSIEDLAHVPFGICIALREAMAICRNSPPTDLPAPMQKKIYTLLVREDLLMEESADDNFNMLHASNNYNFEDNEENPESNTQLSNMLFEDRRLQHVYNMLNSTRPVLIRRDLLNMSEDDLDGFDPNNGSTEQQNILHKLKLLTQSLPIGRGMLSLGTKYAETTDRLKIPPMVLSARLKRGRGFIGIDFGKIFNPHNPWQQLQLTQGPVSEF